MKHSITPKGWVKSFLQTQLDGLTGHIEVAGAPFGVVEWGQPDVLSEGNNPSWWGYEQTGYWLDGYLRCAILTNDKTALDRAAKIVYNTLNAADEDGYIGPSFLKNPHPREEPSRWAHVVFFRSCMALYDYNKDEFILRAMVKHYLNDRVDYTINRNLLNVEMLVWLYEKTGNSDMLRIAERAYADYNEKCTDDICDRVALSDKKPHAHGVSYNEYSKLGAILYPHTKNKRHLDASVAAYKKLDKHFMLPDGLHNCDEYMFSDGIMHGHETCCITDYTWSLNYLFEASRNVEYLDKIEKCVFNAGLGTVTDDFRALQYFSYVNQLVVTGTSNHSLFDKGNSAISYRPRPMTACCTGNVNRFMPNYVMNMWSAKEKDVWLKLYGASEFSHDGIRIVEETEYPYENVVRLKIECDGEHSLHLRVPKWAEGYSLDCEKAQIIQEKGGFVTLRVESSCELLIEFECSLKRHKKRNGVWFSRGCLVYAYAPEYDMEVDEQASCSSKEFPAYNICVKGEFAYGVSEDCKAQVESDSTVSLEVHKLSNWKLQRKKKIKVLLGSKTRYEYRTGDYLFTPPLPTHPVKENDQKVRIKLVPYGKTLCRVTVFPWIKNN